MKFVVSSTELLSRLQNVSRVISNKSTIPALLNFLFEINNGTLTITASDLETTMRTQMTLDNVDGEGRIAIEAKRLTDILKEFPEQPLIFEINLETKAVDILSENGKYSVLGQNADEYPNMPQLDESQTLTVNIPGEVLLKGINKTLFATSDDELRPVMTGIFMLFNAEGTTFVASDAHKLVRFKRNDVTASSEASFILPKKPAGMLKNILGKEVGEIKLQFDDKNAHFTMSDYEMICRLLEGQYPKYESVIPKDNPNRLTINRADLATTLKRVSVFANQASNLIKFELTANQVTVSAQDIDFSISAYEHINGQYDGEEMGIGFKSAFMFDILQAIESENVVVAMSDPSRACLVFPLEPEAEHEDLLMLIMPMMIND
ncbi:MAG: DNA polymerase III subunit beta [Bacteroidales bacterium]|nr:DNA polymerase III subunit beta [Bacteroidales bacterium]